MRFNAKAVVVKLCTQGGFWHRTNDKVHISQVECLERIKKRLLVKTRVVRRSITLTWHNQKAAQLTLEGALQLRCSIFTSDLRIRIHKAVGEILGGTIYSGLDSVVMEASTRNFVQLKTWMNDSIYKTSQCNTISKLLITGFWKNLSKESMLIVHLSALKHLSYPQMCMNKFIRVCGKTEGAEKYQGIGVLTIIKCFSAQS